MTSNLTLIVTGGTSTAERYPALAVVGGSRRTYDAARSRAIAYGRWQGLVPAGPARHHVRKLIRAGLTWDDIAQRAGVSRAVIRALLVGASGRPRSTRVRSLTQAALLSVPVPSVPPRGTTRTDATATRRRLQALVTCGWPLKLVARRFHLCSRALFDTLHGRRSSVSHRTAFHVAEAYDELWDADPAVYGARAADTRAARRLAARQLWAPPMAWDDDSIGDPAVRSEHTGRCGTTGGYYDHSQIGTPTCQPCRDAVRAAAAERKTRRRNRAA